MVWTGTSGIIQTNFHFHDLSWEPNGNNGHMKKPGFNTKFYFKTLEEHLKSVSMGTNMAFQQDNAPIHTAKKSQEMAKNSDF